jgi:hypothetical protein
LGTNSIADDDPTLTMAFSSPQMGSGVPEPCQGPLSSVLLLPDSADDDDDGTTTVSVPYVRFVLTAVNWLSSSSSTNGGRSLPIAGAAPNHDHARHGTISEHVWTEFWSELEPIVARMKWYDMLVIRLFGPGTSSWVPFAPMLYTAYFQGPRLFPNIPMGAIWIGWMLLYMGIDTLVRIYVRTVWAQTLTLLQDVCARHQESNFAALGWALECEYEWWMETGLRWVGSISSRGFRLYLIPNPSNNSSSDGMVAPSINKVTAASSLPPMYHNGYLRMPLFQPGLCCRWSPSCNQLCVEAYQLLPAGFDTLNDGVWLRFWTEWQSVSTDYLWAHRWMLVISGASVGLLWIPWVLSLVLDGKFTILVIFIYVLVMGLSWLVAYCRFGALFHKRRHLARLHLDDFVQQGYYLEHRTMTERNAGCCGQLGTVHYWNLHRLPLPALLNDPNGLI